MYRNNKQEVPVTPKPNVVSSAKQKQPSTGSTSNSELSNKKTLEEEEVFKNVVGPVLVAGLSELCVNRPKDPVEYLGQWLIRYRYNQELQRRDAQTLLEHLEMKDICGQADDALEIVCEGFTPKHPQKPLAYGGPLDITYTTKCQSQNVIKSGGLKVGEIPSQKSNHSMKSDTTEPNAKEVEIPKSLQKKQSSSLGSSTGSKALSGGGDEKEVSSKSDVGQRSKSNFGSSKGTLPGFEEDLGESEDTMRSSFSGIFNVQEP